MNAIRALFATFIAVCLVLVGVLPASAARAESTVTFTIDAATSDPRIDIYEVARDWSKNTDITVVVGSCSGGFYCIHMVSETNPCDDVGLGGCYSRLADGSCKASVAEYWVKDGGPTTYIAKHEFGHCIGIRHIDNERAVMYYAFSAGVQKHTLTNVDREAARALY